jgi:GNAT superfamily N-acetyltransferase
MTDKQLQSKAVVRKIHKGELSALLELYRYLHEDDAKLVVNADLERLWQRILNDPQLHYLVADMDGKIVSSCTLAIILNLTRGAKPYGLIENVLTHPEFRKQSLGTRVLQAALKLAWEQDCYKVMLLTGRKDPATLRFYERAGFEGGIKTGFIAKQK